MTNKNAFLEKDYFKFFAELTMNNRKEWFDENKKRYNEKIKLPFENLVAALLGELSKKDARYAELKPSDCIFRINRNVRFSKDKSPYKTNRSAVITVGGRKNMELPGFYFEIGADNCVCYTGVYMPDSEQLLKIREKIASQPKELDKIINDKTFKKDWGSVLGEKNKKLSKELQEAASTQALIYNKQFYCKHDFDPELALKPGFEKYILGLIKSADKYNQFLTV